MPSLGTLVTVVTADTSGFTAGMNTAAEQTKQFEAKAKSSQSTMSAWGKELETVGHKFQTLGGLFKIGFGVGTAKAVLSEVHHALVNFGEGFGEAQKAGEGFFASIEDGLRNVVGMETHFQQLAEDAKKLAAVLKEVSSAVFSSGHFPFDNKEFPFVSGADAERTRLRGIFEKAQAAASPYQEQVEQERTRVARFESLNGRSSLQEDRGLKEATERAKPFAKAEDAARQALQDFEERMKERNEANKEAIRFEHEFEDEMKAWEEANKEAEEAAKELAKRQEEMAKALQEDMHERQAAFDKVMEEKRKLENAPTAADVRRFGGLADLHNQLQMAALGGSDAPTKTEQKNQTKRLDDINSKLKAMDDKIVPIVWA